MPYKGSTQSQKRKPRGQSDGGQFDFKRLPADKPEISGNDVVRELLDDLQTSVSQIDTVAEMHRWLDFAAQFRRYSFRNAMLIRMQNRNATFVGSYKRLNELGFQVRKGEKAIKILAPLMVLDRDAPVDPETGKQPQKFVGFKYVPVFDISQCDEIPGTEHQHQTTKIQYGRSKLAPGEVPAGMHEAITAAIEKHGYSIRDEERSLFGVIGYTSHSEKLVVIPSNASPVGRMQTLAHELGHIVMEHKQQSSEYHKGGVEHDRMEIEAEAVAHVLAQAWGLYEKDDERDQSKRYVSHYAQSSRENIQAAMQNVMKQASKLPLPPVEEFD